MLEGCCIDHHKLFELRMSAKLTRHQLAKKCGVNHMAIWRIESIPGHRAPHCAIIKLTRFFEVPENYFDIPIEFKPDLEVD